MSEYKPLAAAEIRSRMACCDNDCEHLILEPEAYTWHCERFGADLERTGDGYEEHYYEAFRCAPCLLAMLTPSSDAPGAVEEAIMRLCERGQSYIGFAGDRDTLVEAYRGLEAELTALKSGPTDAAVREAVRYFDDLRGEWSDEQLEDHLETLLSHIRAAQGHSAEPMSEEVENALDLMRLHGMSAHADVLYRAAQAPRLTGERLRAVKNARTMLAAHGYQNRVGELDAAFPELGEG